MKIVNYEAPALGSKYFTFSLYQEDVVLHEEPYVLRCVSITKDGGVFLSRFEDGSEAVRLQVGVYTTFRAAAVGAAEAVYQQQQEAYADATQVDGTREYAMPIVYVYGVYTEKGRKTVERAFKGIEMEFMETGDGW